MLRSALILQTHTSCPCGLGDRFPVLFRHQFVQEVDDALLKACSIPSVGEGGSYRCLGLWLDKEGDGGPPQATRLDLVHW